MRNKLIFALVFIICFQIQIAYAAMIGITELIIILIIGTLFLAFIVGMVILIYSLIKRNSNKTEWPNTININQQAPYQQPATEPKITPKEAVPNNNKIALPQQNETRYVAPEEILRCEADNNYTNFFFSNGEKLLISKSLKEYSDLLKPQGFLRAHQSHLVNTKFVKSWLKEDGGTLLMDNGDKIPVSKPNRELVKQVLGK